MFEQELAKVRQLVTEQEEWRSRCLNLIASEQVMSRFARSLMGSDFCHRYAEGHPGERYYQGTDKIDEIEVELKKELKQLFHCQHTEVRPISGTVANEAVFSRYINYGDIVISNSTPGGGHISHQKTGSVGKYTRNVLSFPRAADGYHIDVGKTKSLIRQTRPSTIVFGKSLFLFPEPIRELHDVCGRYNVHIVYDGAHVLGLIAGGQFQQPLEEGAELITASTHKTFPGPQRGLIISNLDWRQWREIDQGAFPGSSSNHHLDTLAPMLAATYEMRAFGREYAAQIVANAKRLAETMHKLGLDVEAAEFGYTASHQVAVNMARWGGGNEVSRKLRQSDIILNMNLLPGEPLKNHDNPSGARIGVQEMTHVGMKEQEMDEIAQLIAACLMDDKNVRDDVHKLRAKFQDVKYSFDDVKKPPPAG